MIIPFWKMHGAGNDFLLINDQERGFPVADTAWIKKICTRKTGVGCDGVVLIQESREADFRMRFINPDGSEVEMCGNGARCVSRLASDLGLSSTDIRIETSAGVIKAKVMKNSVCLFLTNPTDLKLADVLEIEANTFHFSYVNSGVEHVVVEVTDLKSFDVKLIGRKIRYHPRFSPWGTNVNFIQITGPHGLSIRTYERGVEAETLACGTGIVASGVVASALGKVAPPIQIQCASGDILEVACDIKEHGVENVKLIGPAEYVFKGDLVYGNKF